MRLAAALKIAAIGRTRERNGDSMSDVNASERDNGMHAPVQFHIVHWPRNLCVCVCVCASAHQPKGAVRSHGLSHSGPFRRQPSCGLSVTGTGYKLRLAGRDFLLDVFCCCCCCCAPGSGPSALQRNQSPQCDALSPAPLSSRVAMHPTSNNFDADARGFGFILPGENACVQPMLGHTYMCVCVLCSENSILLFYNFSRTPTTMRGNKTS